jgi:endonuclease/exonuclease/phosphatase family metal-dependent hydrolase
MQPPAGHVRLLTFNCFGVPFAARSRARLITLGRELNESDLDIICLQEVQFAPYVALLRRVLPGFPHVAFTPFVHAPKGGLVTLSRWPVEQTHFHLYTTRGPWHTPAVADRLLHKGMLITRITMHQTPVVVLNTHLLANYSGDWSRHNRYARHQHAQLRQLGQVVNSLGRDRAVVVAGDLNVPRGSWLYHGLVQASDLRDPLAGDTHPTYRQAFLMPGRYAQPIDFVFVRPPAAQRLTASARLVLQEKVWLVTGQHDYLSDHCGVQADITWLDAAGPSET